MHLDDMVLLPADGFDEHGTQPEAIPWLTRPGRSVPLWKRWLHTVGYSLVLPGRIGGGMAYSRSKFAALKFSLLTTGVTLLVATSVILAILVIPSLLLGAGGGAGAARGAMIGLTSLAGALVIGLLVIFVGSITWGLITHAVLLMTGPTDGGLRRTLDAIYYASGTAVLILVPCLGVYGMWHIWMSVSACIIVCASQRVAAWRAVLAVLTLPLLCLIVIGVFYAWLFSTMASGAALTAPPPLTPARVSAVYAPSAAQAATTQMLMHLLNHSRVNQQWPPHGASMIGFSVAAVEFVLDPDQLAAVPLGEGSLESLEHEDGWSSAVQAAAAALPPNVIAHRLGDFVFTYHGISTVGTDPELWLVVCTPAPGAIADPTFQSTIVVGLADGSTRTVTPTQFSIALAEQNQLRQVRGLAPLPDITLLTHDRPATSDTAAAPEPPDEPPS